MIQKNEIAPSTNVPNFELDDPALLCRVDDARNQLRQPDHGLTLAEAQHIFKQASTEMSKINGVLLTIKNDTATHVGNLNTLVEDLTLLVNNKLPAGYEGNLRACLNHLQTKIRAEATTTDTIRQTIGEMAKSIELMFFKLSTVYTTLGKRIEIYEKTIGEIPAKRAVSTDFSLDSELSG
jgi:hypothetical protein